MKRFLIFFIGAIAILGLNFSFAAAQKSSFIVDIYIDSVDENINAYGTRLTLPDSWSVNQLILEDSQFIFWITAPQNPYKGTLYFSGIFPGGVYNLNNYVSPLLLFSIQITGNAEEINKIVSSETEIYLNHPLAPEAEKSHFSYRIRGAGETVPLIEAPSLKNLDYRFVTNPIDGSQTLVINNACGAFASYSFKVKEGDFFKGDWIDNINGITPINSQNSTVSLLAISPTGEDETLILRSSLLRKIFAPFTVLFSLGLFSVFYLKRKRKNH